MYDLYIQCDDRTCSTVFQIGLKNTTQDGQTLGN